MKMAETAQYACTKCMQWFRFDQLSKEQQMCAICSATSVKVKPSKKEKARLPKPPSNCKYCQTDMQNKTIVNGEMCERCGKNFKEHGEPSKCIYCKLPSAFIGSKCQRCSSSQKKYGIPVNCQNCDLKAAFDHAKARPNGLLLCWLCYVTMQKQVRKEKRKAEAKLGKHSDAKKSRTAEPKKSRSPSPGSCDQVWKDLFGEDKDYRTAPEVVPSEGDTKEEKRRASDRSSARNELRRKAQLNSKHIADRKRFGKTRRRKSSLDARLETFGKKLSATSTQDEAAKASAPKKAEKPASNSSTPRQDTPLVDNSPSTPSLGLGLKTSERMRNGSSLEIGSFPIVNDSNIVVVTKLREEISSLKKQLSKKDQQLLEKDKQISMLKVNHLQEERTLQGKLKSQEDEFLKSTEATLAKNHELLKKIAQLSKGKKPDKPS